MPISLTEKAAERAQKYLKTRGKGIGLKLGVKTTGCSGMAYTLEFVDDIGEIGLNASTLIPIVRKILNK